MSSVASTSRVEVRRPPLFHETECQADRNEERWRRKQGDDGEVSLVLIGRESFSRIVHDNRPVYAIIWSGGGGEDGDTRTSGVRRRVGSGRFLGELCTRDEE